MWFPSISYVITDKLAIIGLSQGEMRLYAWKGVVVNPSLYIPALSGVSEGWY